MDDLIIDESEEAQKPSQPPTADSSINEYRKHLWDALRAGQEQYDKYLLTLSGGGLAISLTLIKDVFSKTQLTCPSTLIFSWAFFCISITFTIASFMTSQKSLRTHLDNYETYIATGNDEKLKAHNPNETLTNFLNYASGVCFFIAVVATIVFASMNLNRGVFMSNEHMEELKKGYNAPSAPTLQRINEGNPPPAPTQQQQPSQPAPTEGK